MSNISLLLKNKNKIDAVAIGCFDGLHLGHKKLIQELGKNGALIVIRSREATLLPNDELEKTANIPCFFYEFNKIKNLLPDDFIRLLHNDFINLKKIVVGYDFRFGLNKIAGVKELKKLFLGEVCVVDEFCINGIGVHSCKIKNLIKSGDIKLANTFLGREYKIKGLPTKGQGLGSKQLVPTINLITKNYEIPGDGVYATYTSINNKRYKSVSFTGCRFSTDGNFAIETHIIDHDFLNNFNSNDEVEIYFIEKIRNNFKFKNLHNLKIQINQDIQNAKAILDER